MIEYEYLCQAIEAFKQGHRPSMPPPGAAAYAHADAAEQLDADEYAYEDDDGAPAVVTATGTQPIVADAGAEGGASEVDEGGQAYDAYADQPAYQDAGGAESEFDPSSMAADEDLEGDLDLEEVDVEDEDLDAGAEEDEEEDDFERDYDLEEIDDFAAFDFNNDISAYFRAEMQIESAWEDKGTRLATLQQYGVRDETHWYQVKATLVRYVQSDEAETRWGGLDDIMQLQANARMDASTAQMQARAQGELAGELEPFMGVSLEQWAGAQARLASGGDADAIIAELGIDRAHWDAVSAEWNARMSRDTTATVATAYGNAFATSGQGQFAGAAADGVGAMAAGGDVSGAAPVPMERYVEIMVAQSAAASQGMDANEVLAQFGINAMEWGQIGGWWGAQIARHGMENGQALLHRFNELQAHYEAQYGVADADEDVEF